MPQVKPEIETFAKIKVIGVGGGGNSAVNRMVGNRIRGVDFVVVNTDVQALHHNAASTKIHIGKTVTKGLGAGMNPDLGRKAAEESQNDIREMLKGTDMVFITCGLGGGTGTGAAPLVAEIARELGVLTVAVTTKPFSFEGPKRGDIAQQGWEDLAKNVDAIITIPNDRILQMIDKKTSLLDSFKIVDDILGQGVQGIAELITIPGIINVDFADIKTIMSEAGSALMGIGTASGDNRSVEAAKIAISSPLLELSIDGASGILFTITGGNSITMDEVNEAAKVITSSASEDARIIFGANIDENMKDDIKITVVATGFENRSVLQLSDDENEKTINRPLSFSPANSFLRRTKKEEEEENKRFQKIVDNYSELPVDQEEESKESSRFFGKKIDNTTNNTGGSSNMINKKTVNKDSKKSTKEEDDWDVPAFLRKKMG